MSEWISVKDRLPTEKDTQRGMVFVWADGYEYVNWGYLGRLAETGEEKLWTYDRPPATHWMPLPEPPED